MGSWNHTCMISRMPIVAGEEVVSIFLAQRTPEVADDIRCYVHALYDPLPFLIYGKYNDYGAVDRYTGPCDGIVINWFRNHVLELEENDRDPAVKREEITSLDQLYDLDHENRLFISFDAYRHKAVMRPLDHIVIKRKLFDRILEHTMLDSYQSSGHYHYKFKDLAHNLDATTRWLKEHWTPYDENDESVPPSVRVARMMASIRGGDVDSLIRDTWHNTDIPPLCAWLRKKEWHGLPDPFVDEFKKADFEFAKTLLLERLKFSWLETWLSWARHWWQVPGNVGGQEEHFEYHEMLANFMLGEIKHRRAEYEGDEWDEADENAA